MKAKLYRLMAIIFAMVGTVMFLTLYFKNVDGNIIGALKRPLLLCMMIIPFLPAIVLSRRAHKYRKALLALTAKPEAAATAAAPAPAPEK